MQDAGVVVVILGDDVENAFSTKRPWWTVTCIAAGD